MNNTKTNSGYDRKKVEEPSILFGESLVFKGLIGRKDLDLALEEQSESGGRIGQVLVRLGMLSGEQVTSALAEYLSTEYVPLDDLSHLDMEVARSLPESIARRFNTVAINQQDDKLVVAMADPLDVVAIDTIGLKMNRDIKAVVSSPERIRQAIETIYHGSDVEEQRLRDLVKDADVTESKNQELSIEDTEDSEDGGEAEATKAPVVQFVDLLLKQAVKSKASDIHIEPQERSMIIRMRIDGVLREMVPPAQKMQAAVSTRIKILSGMDIAERRLPQDGRMKVRTAGRGVDIRVSAIPTIYGEKIVMRILDAAAVNHELDALGFEKELLDDLKGVLSQPHGIAIVTGPTGSGKSTTLYSALNYMKDPEKNITTVEDPVEYRLHGINQVQVKPEIKLDFARCLRAILRQDPDIILIGEIRDKETAEIAIKASLTGHLVLSTFHTNDAPSAISRMNYMGVERYLLASSLNLIIAQRLVRRVCERCKKPVKLNDKALKGLGVKPADAKKHVFYKGKGCNACGNTGYSGRLPIFEFLMIDKDTREMIVNGASESEIRKASREKGYGGLLESGVRKLTEGTTTAEEVLRVAYMENVRS